MRVEGNRSSDDGPWVAPRDRIPGTRPRCKNHMSPSSRGGTHITPGPPTERKSPFCPFCFVQHKADMT
jgi:hypothetical protein